MRTGLSNPLGKLTAVVKTRLSEDTFDELERESSALGLNVSEFVRELLMVRIHGAAHVNSLYRNRTEAVAGIGPLETTE